MVDGMAEKPQLTVWDLLALIAYVILTMGLLFFLFNVFELVFFSIVNFRCGKFLKMTVKGNYRGMRVLGIITETLVLIDAFAVILVTLSAIPQLINEWGGGEFNAVTFILALLPLLSLGYGIYTWIHFLSAKKLYDHIFPKTSKKRSKTDYDSAQLFGDSKDPLKEIKSDEEVLNRKNAESVHIEVPEDILSNTPESSEDSTSPLHKSLGSNSLFSVDPPPKEKTILKTQAEIDSTDSEEEWDNTVYDEDFVQTTDTRATKIQPSESGGELTVCPYCGSLNTIDSPECSFCGAVIK